MASIPYGSTGEVFAAQLSNAGDLGLPLSVMWTGEMASLVKCGGADLDGLGSVNLSDFAILASQWNQPPGSPSADIAPQPTVDGAVDILDLAVLAEHWLETDCN